MALAEDSEVEGQGPGEAEAHKTAVVHTHRGGSSPGRPALPKRKHNTGDEWRIEYEARHTVRLIHVRSTTCTSSPQMRRATEQHLEWPTARSAATTTERARALSCRAPASTPPHKKHPDNDVQTASCRHPRVQGASAPVSAHAGASPRSRKTLSGYSTFFLKEQPSVRRALPPVGWQSTVEQPPQITTVCAWLKTVVLRRGGGGGDASATARSRAGLHQRCSRPRRCPPASKSGCRRGEQSHVERGQRRLPFDRLSQGPALHARRRKSRRASPRSSNPAPRRCAQTERVGSA